MTPSTQYHCAVFGCKSYLTELRREKNQLPLRHSLGGGGGGGAGGGAGGGLVGETATFLMAIFLSILIRIVPNFQ